MNDPTLEQRLDHLERENRLAKALKVKVGELLE